MNRLQAGKQWFLCFGGEHNRFVVKQIEVYPWYMSRSIYQRWRHVFPLSF